MSKPTPAIGRILIGEDVRVIAFKMAQALERAGYAVETANDGEECLRKARENLPDLVVLDIMMPRIHGIEVLKTLREEHRTAKIGVLICTAKDFKTEHDEAVRLGVFDFLIKPFEPAQLVEKVDLFFTRRGRYAGVPEFPTPTVDLEAGGEPYCPVLDTTRPRFTFWGVRGSTPTPGARFLRTGGNTSCFSVASGEEIFIFDAGTGIRDLGLDLLCGPPRKLHLFVTHTHWDHIQGFPFFAPAYVPGFDVVIYGAEGFGKDLKSVFRGQLDREYFPVQMEDMHSHLQFRHLTANPMTVGSAKIWWEFAQHPGATVGYKIEIEGKKIAWVPDNEFLQGYTGSPEEITREHPLALPYANMIDFLSDADLVIHEAQYTPEEYPKKIRWGHSSVANACVLMKLAGVKRWFITHHDPMHDDGFLEAKLCLTRQILEKIGHPIPVSHAYDGRTEYFA
jgi:phosphoribosyl 1,2-cyclic phosphodiesterase/ActR/RegA family two-component response regulator